MDWSSGVRCDSTKSEIKDDMKIESEDSYFPWSEILADFSNDEQKNDQIGSENDVNELQRLFNEKVMSMESLFEEKDRLFQEFSEETKNMPCFERDTFKKILDDQEKLRLELEVKRKEMDLWDEQLRASTEHIRQILDGEKIKCMTRDASLQMAFQEERKTKESVLRLVEEQKKEHRETWNRLLQLEDPEEAKQLLDMEIEDIEMKLPAEKHLGEEDDSSIEENIKDMKRKFQEEMANLEDMYQAVMVQERRGNDELQRARQTLVKGWAGRTNHITVKIMGELDMKPFVNACNLKYSPSEAGLRAAELASIWEARIKDTSWHPFKVVPGDGDTHQEIVVEEDETLQKLKLEGPDVYEAVLTAKKEVHQYNASGGYGVCVLWNLKENRSATLEEGIQSLFKKRKK